MAVPRERGSVEGWQITLWAAIAALSMAGLALGFFGFSEEGLHAVVRYSARGGVWLFLLAFAARPLRQVWTSPFTAWLLRNRRYVGLAFAAWHLTHLLALGGLALAFPDPFLGELGPGELYGGGFIYLQLFVMVVTSNDASLRLLGRPAWRRLHAFASYGLWIAFLSSYGGRVAAGLVSFTPCVVGLVGVFALRIGVRIAVWLRRPGRGHGPGLRPLGAPFRRRPRARR